VTIDWTVRESAQLRVIVKRILRKYSYPPDKQKRRRRRSVTIMVEFSPLSAGSVKLGWNDLIIDNGS
jgi:type I restriction enzyme, R subunit